MHKKSPTVEGAGDPARALAIIPPRPVSALWISDCCAVAQHVPASSVTGMIATGSLSPVALYNLQVGESEELSDALNTELLLVGWVARPSEPIEAEDNSGPHQYTQTRLLTADDRVIRAGSRGIFESVVALTKLFGLGPWDPPLRVIPKSRPVPGVGHWYYLFLLGRS